MGRKHCGKRRNCSLRAISSFPTVFSKDFYCRHVKTRVCLGKGLGLPTLKIGIFNRFISFISVVLQETTLTISVSTGELVSMETEIVRVVSLSSTEISEITRLKIRSSRSMFDKDQGPYSSTIPKNILCLFLQDTVWLKVS